MSPATYGVLLQDATRHLEDGRRELHLDRFDDRRHAEARCPPTTGCSTRRASTSGP